MSITLQEIDATKINPHWVTQPFNGFCLDSRHVEAGQIFIALNSYSQPQKTKEFAEVALQKGALGVIAEQDLGLPSVLVCPEIRQKMGEWQKQYLQANDAITPLNLIAVTGTNGKTTISRLIAEIIMFQGHRCAVMGTTGNGILPELTSSTHTTLNALHLQEALHGYAKQGATFAALEASSHGLEQGRLNGCDIQIAVYSNLSRDHLDYHGTLESYAAAKAELFAFESLKTAVINLDDDYAHLMQNMARQNPSQPKVITYSLNNPKADVYVSDLSFSLKGALFTLHAEGNAYQIQSPLLGHFNVENLIASLIAVHATGVSFEQIICCIPQLKGAPGRMQVIRDEERLFVVDYAHTPDALIQVLVSLKRHANARLWVVFGCGGDRDRGKRPLMTQAALAHGNPIVLTSDNPRHEIAEQIFADMKKNIDFSSHQMHEIHDRREAIKLAVRHAKAGDIVVIAGKGHENYQEIEGVRHWFDDVVEVESAIQHVHKKPSAYSALD